MSPVDLGLVIIAGVAAAVVVVYLLPQRRKSGRHERIKHGTPRQQDHRLFDPAQHDWPLERPAHGPPTIIPLERTAPPSPPAYSQRNYEGWPPSSESRPSDTVTEEHSTAPTPVAPNAVEMSAELHEPSVTEPAHPPQPQFSDGLVRDLYSRWCSSGTRPHAAENVQVVPLRYLRSEAPREYGGPQQHILQDARQVAEFVRFSQVNSDVGLVLPNPEAHFTPVVNYLFPHLTRSDYETPSTLSALVPIRVQKRGAEEWEAA